MKMGAKIVQKPWGQRHVPHLPEGAPADLPIGEVWFEHPSAAHLPVLVKYLYTSERLSIQVHPNNHQARAMGHASGKDEMWIVLDAQPGATIGLGLTRQADAEELRHAIEDGSIVELVDWRPVAKGDVIYNPAGTVHAAGAGLVLLEVQQSVDLTYRLYDYGRPRDLHLAEGLAVAVGKPHYHPDDCSVAGGTSRLLTAGPYFGAAWCVGELPSGIPQEASDYQLVVIEGRARVGETAVSAGECFLAKSLGQIEVGAGSTVLVAWAVQAQVLALAA